MGRGVGGGDRFERGRGGRENGERFDRFRVILFHCAQAAGFCEMFEGNVEIR